MGVYIQMERKFLGKIYDRCNDDAWNIGFTCIDPATIFKNETLSVQWMKHSCHTSWFADPFILKITDKEIILLAEEYYKPARKGRISRLTVDKKTYRLKSCDIALELKTHLSFPVIYRKENDIFIYPESSSTKKLVLYKYFEDQNKAEPVSTLVDDPLTDAVITADFGKPYLFSTKSPDQNKNILHIYSSPCFDGVYNPYQTISFEDNTARNAGNLFLIDNKWIRPAQNCNGGYGVGLVFQEVIYSGNNFSFKELKRFYPNPGRWGLGMHTFNVAESIAVIDGKGYWYPVRSLLLRKIKAVRDAMFRRGVA
jgi:hypothetical protein